MLLLSGLAANGQHTLSGIVTDKSDPAKLIDGVSVYIPEFDRFDVSKEGGTYILHNIGTGTVTVEFVRTGYKPVIRTVSTTDSATVLHVEMEQSSLSWQDVSLLSSRLRLSAHSPFASSVIQADALRRHGALHPMAGLSYEPGIDRSTAGNSIQRPVIRGISGSRIVSHQFGVRMENQAWDAYQDMELHDAGTEFAEMVKGPASVIYGPNASGGVLLWREKASPRIGTTVGQVDLAYHSNTAGLEGGFGINGASNSGIVYAFNVLNRSHTSYVQGDTGAVTKNTEDKFFAQNSKLFSNNVKAMIGLTRKWGLSKLTYSLLSQKQGIVQFVPYSDTSYIAPGSITESERSREIEGPYIDVASHVLSSGTTVLLGKNSLDVNLSYQSTRRSYVEDVSGESQDRVILTLATFNYDVRFTTDPGRKQGIATGVQGMLQRNSNSGLTSFISDADINDLGAYAMVHHQADKFKLLAGGRFDHRSIELTPFLGPLSDPDPSGASRSALDYSGFSASAGVHYAPLNFLNVKANVSKGFAAPNAHQLSADGISLDGKRIELGSDDLDAENNWNTDLGITFSNPSFTLQASGYFNQIGSFTFLNNSGTVDTVVQNGLTVPLPVYNYVQRDASVKGTEISANLHPVSAPWLVLDLKYALVRSELNEGDDRDLPMTPADKLIAGVTFKKDQMNYLYSPYLQVVVSNYFQQDRVASFESTSDGYVLFDLHLGGSFKWSRQFFDVSLSATNLLNTGYMNHLSVVRDSGVREMGRNVSVRLKVPFGIYRSEERQ